MAKADKDTKKAKKPKKHASKKAAAKKTAGVTKKAKTAAKKTAKAAAKKPAAKKASVKKTDTNATDATAAEMLDSALLPATSGKIGVFGGPKDRGIQPEDKLALPTGKHFTFERVRSLNPKSFYCAMRWEYHASGQSIEEGKRWWANKKLLVTNPANNTSVVVRAVDFGPPESTGLSIAVSPGAAEALGVEVGDEVEIAFADVHLPVGTIE